MTLRLLMVIALGLSVLRSVAAVPLAFSWGKVLGSSGSDLVGGVAVDANGYSYAAGSFESTVQFGTNSLTSVGGRDVFIAKFSPNGDVIWARRFGGTSYDLGYAVAVDSDGNVYAAGTFMGTASFGTTNLTATVGSDSFVAKLDANGVVLWVRQISGQSDDYALALATVPGGGVCTCGFFVGSVSIAGIPLSGGSGNSQSMFVAYFGADGQVMWASQATGSQVTASGIAVDSSANIYVAGYFYGAAIFSGIPLTSGGNADSDAFLAKYALNGSLAWATNSGGTGTDSAFGVTVSTNGAVYVCGVCGSSATFGAINVSGSSANNFYVAKYSNAGEALWVRTGPNGNGTSVAVSSSGVIFALGYSEGASGGFSFGGFSLNGANGTTNSFLAELAEDGTPQNLIPLYGSSSVYAGPLATGPEDSVLLGGFFTGNAAILNGTLAGTGSLDGFVIRLAPPPFRVRIEPAAGGIQLAWPGVYSNATVNASPSLGAAADWRSVAGTPSVSGGEQVLPLSSDLPQRYFRLQK